MVGDPLFERSRVEREVGKDAFDYGFLIGNEDLIGDVKADIFITFPHRSIQEFFGAFFFVLQLLEGKDIGSILGPSYDDSIFMNNVLFLHFIFWFLSDQCGGDYFTLGNRDAACEILHSYIYSKVYRELGRRSITEKFPPLDFQKALETKDKINTEHFERILERFDKIKYITIGSSRSVVEDWILNRIVPTCRALNVVAEDESHEYEQYVLPEYALFDENVVNILLSEEANQTGMLKYLCGMASLCQKETVVFLFNTKERYIILCDILYPNMRKLHVMSSKSLSISASEERFSCPILTHLSITGSVLPDKSAFHALNKALREGKLPLLQSFCFKGAAVEDKLKYLFDGKSILPRMIHLNLCDCVLREEDVRCLCFSSNNGLLPKLTSLEISDDILSLQSRDNFFTQNWVNLSSLSVTALTKSGFKKLTEAIEKKKLTNLKKLCVFMVQNEKCEFERIRSEKVPLMEHLCVHKCFTSKTNLKHLSHLIKGWKLQTLDISHSRGIEGKLSVLMSHKFPSLRNLVLHDCDLNEHDMICLWQANNKEKLPELTNLDLSENVHLICCFDADTEKNSLAKWVFGVTSSWGSLKRLRIDHESCHCTRRNGFDILTPLLENGYLPTIVELSVNSYTPMLSTTSIGQWQHLKRLDIFRWTYEQCIDIHHCLTDALEKGDLPALETVCLFTDNKTASRFSDETKLFPRLKRNNVDVFIIAQQSLAGSVCH